MEKDSNEQQTRSQEHRLSLKVSIEDSNAPDLNIFYLTKVYFSKTCSIRFE